MGEPTDDERETRRRVAVASFDLADEAIAKRDAEIARLRTDLDDIKASLEGISAVGYREGVLAERAHSLKATADGDAEIARLKTEVERLTTMVRERDVALVNGVAGWLPKAAADNLRADLARHKRALAAGPAALREGSLVRAAVEIAQADAMKEKP